MSAETYKATFRKKDGLAMFSFKATKESLPDSVAAEMKALFKGEVVRDGFVIEVKPDER